MYHIFACRDTKFDKEIEQYALEGNKIFAFQGHLLAVRSQTVERVDGEPVQPTVPEAGQGR